MPDPFHMCETDMFSREERILERRHGRKDYGSGPSRPTRYRLCATFKMYSNGN